MSKYLSIALFTMLLLFTIGLQACDSGSETEPDGDWLDGDQTDGDDENSEADLEEAPQDVAPIFSEGCPVPGKASVVLLTTEEQKMQGPDVIGTIGDVMLMNEKAAFVISSPENINAYYLYGGILVDAVAVDGCRQASQERFEELGILFGILKLNDFSSSILRAFKGESVEIINDGSDGEAAIVRVHGSDDFFWLVEDELIITSLSEGKTKGLSSPFGMNVTVDYILPPDSNVLQIDLTLANQNNERLSLLAATELMFGDTTPVRFYSDSDISAGGFTLQQGVPWLAASGGDGAWAFAMKDASMATTNISGVTVLLDLNQALSSSLNLAPAGDEKDTATVTYYFSVGPTDANSATKDLANYNSEPIPDMPYTLVAIEGSVVDKDSGDPLGDVLVEVQAQNGNDVWYPLDSFYTDENGLFRGEIPDFGEKRMPLRLQASSLGRPDPDAMTIDLDSVSSYNIEMGDGGTLKLDLKNESGSSIPAKVLLWQDDKNVRRIFSVTGDESILVEPGEYQASVSRGPEYSYYETTLSIDANDTTTLSVTVEHLINTDGFMSADAHCHAGPSPDNTISIPERIRTVAAEGLEVVVATDHEYVNDWYWGVEENYLSDWVATVVGQEVTASLPNHTNMYPVEPDYTVNARGGFVEWYGLDIAEIYAAERARGAEIVGLNHPRKGNYMSLIEYNYETGEPDMTDPTRLGFESDATVWSWDFDTVELMNGPDYIFRNEQNPHKYGTFNDWMSFINFGHSITAVGVSDAHNYGMPGYPRSYFVSSTDNPSQFDEAELVSAMKEGRILVSNGAFARVLIDGEAEMGDTIMDTDGEIDLYLHIEAIPEIDVDYFKVYVNCDQVLNLATTAPDEVIKYDDTIKVTIDQDSHIVVLGFGDGEIPKALKDYDPVGRPRFVTNPIFIDYDGNGAFDAPGGKTCTYDLQGPEGL